MTAHTPPMDLHMTACRRMLGDADTPAFVLLTILLWAFGDELMGDPAEGIEGMDTTEVWAATNERFGVWIPEEGENRLNALMLALQGDLFYRDVEIFRAVVAALPDGDLGDIIDGGVSDLTAADLMWSLLEVEMAAGFDEETRPEFSWGVKDLIADTLREEQEDLSIADENVSEMFDDLLQRLEEIGVPHGALRLLDKRYDPTENPVVDEELLPV